MEWICRAVEGMPLAIILAASWVDVLSLDEIGAEIVRSLDFLSNELGDLPRRQWSIRAVLETAWQRLTERERDIFMGLSVFQGGFTRDAANAVAAAEIAVLRSLVSKSLVGRDVDGRHAVHELLRKYAQEQLERSGQYDIVAKTHAEYFLVLATEGNEALTGPDQRMSVNRLEVEQANFRRAFDWSLSGADIDLGVHLAGALALFWRRRAHYLEATTIGERALSLLGDDSSDASRALHVMLGSIYEPLAQYELATHHYQQSLKIAESRRDSLNTAYAFYGLSRVWWRLGHYESAEICALDSLRAAKAVDQLGLVASHQGNLACAQGYYHRSLGTSEENGDQIGMARTLMGLGWVATAQSHYDLAHEYLIRSLEISEASDFRMDIAANLNTLGWSAEAQGDDACALHYYRRALAIYKTLGLRTGRANTLVNISFVRMRQDAADSAYQNLQQALRIAHENGDLPVVLEILIGFARYYYRTDQIQECIRLAKVADAHPVLNSEARRTRLDPLTADIEATALPGGLESSHSAATALDVEYVTKQLLWRATGSE